MVPQLQAATIKEEGDSDDLATFTITLGGTPGDRVRPRR